MSALLAIGGYFVAALVSTALLIRLRPEWLLSSHVDGAEAEFLSWLTDVEKRQWKEWTDNRYEILYGTERSALRSEVRRRRAKADVSGPAPTYYGLSVPHLALAITPLALVFAFPVSVVIRSTTRSVNNKTKARAELEEDLASAKREIDDLLRRPAPRSGGEDGR